MAVSATALTICSPVFCILRATRRAAFEVSVAVSATSVLALTVAALVTRLRAAPAFLVAAFNLIVARALAGIAFPETRLTSSLLPSSMRSATLTTSSTAGMAMRLRPASAFRLEARSMRSAFVAIRLTPLVARSTATPTTVSAWSVP